MLQLIEDYKKHIAKTELTDEVYKWELVSNFKGRPNLDAEDLLAEIKAIPYGNLLYQLAKTVLLQLITNRPNDIQNLLKILFNEEKNLVNRVKIFNEETLKLYREIGEKRQHHQDERSISTYLTVHNPEKYTFYKSSFYKKVCKLLGVKEAKKNEKYSHYLQLIDEITTKYIQNDNELIDQVKSYIPQYYDGTNNLILAQDILYQMLDRGAEKNYWIFQGNPKFYDVIGALERSQLTWKVAAHKDKFQINDKVIIWLTGDNAGCYALGKITSEVGKYPNSESEKSNYLINYDENEDRIEIEIEHNLYANPILWDTIKTENAFANFKVGNQGTNFSATEEEYNSLLKHLSKLKNVKNEFIDWMIANDVGRHYFSKQFNSNRVRFESEINEYEEIYKKNFNTDLFIVDVVNIAKDIEIINQNIYKKHDRFSEYSNGKASGRPKAILGKNNYLQFLNNYSMNEEVTQKSNSIESSYPLNQILYGPPGTGKTYHTVLEAAKIVSGNENISYDEALDIFNKNLGNQIEFITFHQNYSYEDFIQGLRPDTENGSVLTFEKKDGVFKRIADRALKNLEASRNPAIAKKDFDLVFQELLKPLNEGDIEELEIQMKKSSFFITEVGLKSIEFRKNIGESNHTLSINTLRKMYERGLNDLILGGLQPYYNPILEILLEKGKSTVQNVDEENFVIIIDEINRANISRVFGELITLIEEDKRSHGKIPMRVTLPSGDSFIVPSNLYIIGTMNTADKSIALLDIALRRRFEFVPMYPDLKVEGINDIEVLTAINMAILDRKNHDFTIGHSYFMGDNYSREKTINNKVIPLLLEYFMNDEKEVIAILKEANLTIGNWPLKLMSQND